jgi:hypothetical protein
MRKSGNKDSKSLRNQYDRAPFMMDKIPQNGRMVVGLDLGGTKLAAAVFRVGTDGAVHLEHSLDNIKYQQFLAAEEHKGLSAQGRCKLIEEFLVGAVRDLQNIVGVDNVAAVGVDSAGFVENDIIIEARNIGLKNYPMKRRLEKILNLPTYLYKDSWTPAYAAACGEPCIAFSIGTGFGGVAAEADLSILQRSYTARRGPIWIPYLAYGDDPAYAASFPVTKLAHTVSFAFARFTRGGGALPENTNLEARLDALPSQIKKFAKKQKKLSPGRIEVLVAHTLAPQAGGRFRPNEIFADMPCAADFPALAFSWLTGEEITPPEMDARLAAGDPIAQFGFLIHAEFVGNVLALIHKERREMGLAPMRRIFGTGSGFNAANHAYLGTAILTAMNAYTSKWNIEPPVPQVIELLTPENPATTLACQGAATGAARGLVQP